MWTSLFSANGLQLKFPQTDSKAKTKKDQLKSVVSSDKRSQHNRLQPCTDINHAKQLIHESKQKSVQLTLKDAIEDLVIDQVDTELQATIGRIRSHICAKLNVARVRLFSNDGTPLDDNARSLADHYWDFASETRPQHSWTITVQVVSRHVIDTTY